MKAYHSDPAVKAKYESRFAQHRAADEVIQGQGFDNGRGCFIGCTLDAYDHSRFPTELGWPKWLAQLADSIFEGLPKAEAPQFGTDLLAAVPVGANLETVRVPFLVSTQQRNLKRLEGNNEPYAEQCRTAIQDAIDYLLAGEQESAESARSAAAAAAWSAAESARSAAESAWSAAAESARSAAESARSAAAAAESARSAAAWSAAAAAAESESQTQRDMLLTIIKQLPQ